MRVPGIFDEIAVQMRSDFEKARKALEHAGQKGSSFEEVFRKFLRDYLPNSLDVSTGTLIDANGNSSRQIDVIISDATKTPILYRSGEVRVIPVECVYAVIEVKAYLDSRELDKVLRNMKSVRSLEKKAYYKPNGPIITADRLYGKEWDIWPIMYFAFAIDSIELETLAKSLGRKHEAEGLPEWSRIDTICAPDRGVICNQLVDGKFSALPEPKSRLFPCLTPRSLLLFYTLISGYLFQARLPNSRFLDYVGQLKFRQGER